MQLRSRIKRLDTDKLKEQLTQVPKNPAMLKTIIHELWLTFKQPILIGILAIIAILILIPPLTYLWFVRDLSSKETIINRKNEGVILYDRNDKPFFTLYGGRTRQTTTLDKIPKTMQDAVISSEDRDFYKHPGFSISGIGRAVLADLHQDSLAQGGSTISQQLVKNTLLSQQKSFLRKYQELFLAIEIERRFSKDDILEMYLNTVYFGEGAFGVQEAAKTYFGENASDLTLAQSALLTAILPAPSALSPISGNRDRALERQKLVLSEMVKEHYITKAQADQAAAQTLTFRQETEDNSVEAPHFALMVKDELIKKYGEQRVAGSGFKVKTTIDLNDQQYAETVVKNQVKYLQGSKATNGAAVVIDPKTGEILSLVGSHDWFDETNGKINMATHPRQPGSSFKPIVYAKAIDEHLITAASVLDDKPVTYPGGYTPEDYDHKFRGTVLARRALANSLNIPALHVEEKVGIPDTISFAKSLGITTLTDPSNYGISIVLGAAEVPLVQMTAAYGTFANQGVYVSPTTILEIRDKHNNVVFTHDPDKRTVLSADVAYIISSILSDNAARAEEFGNALTISRPAAVKTGTTNDFKDALTLGYTPSLVVGVWVGNNDNSPMTSIAGSLGAAPIWRQLMEHFLTGTPVEEFTRPIGVVNEMVCKDKGLKADYATSSAYMEYFLTGTLPTADCNLPSPTESVTPTPQTTDTPTPQPTDEPTDTPTPTQTQITPTNGSDTPTPTPIVIQFP